MNEESSYFNFETFSGRDKFWQFIVGHVNESAVHVGDEQFENIGIDSAQNDDWVLAFGNLLEDLIEVEACRGQDQLVQVSLVASVACNQHVGEAGAKF